MRVSKIFKVFIYNPDNEKKSAQVDLVTDTTRVIVFMFLLSSVL